MTDFIAFYPPNNPPIFGRLGGTPVFTVEDVEARLIEAQRVFWRIEGSGRYASWATDGPWFLSRNRDATDYWVARLGLAELGEALDVAGFDPRPHGAMIDRAYEASRWYGLITDPKGEEAAIVTRKLVASVIGQMAGSYRRPRWLDIASPMLKGSTDLKRMRYKRAMEGLVKTLNARASAEAERGQ